MAVTVTETAAREIHSIIQREGLDPQKVCLRVGVKGGGCSGFSYLLDLTEVQKDSDEVWEVSYTAPAANAADQAGEQQINSQQGGIAVAEPRTSEKFSLKVICDPKSYLYLNGTTIDFKDDGMLHRGFLFNNPNATSSCGCGSSFSA